MKKPDKKEKRIRTLEELRKEQRSLKERIRNQETDLRQRVQKIPGELFYAGINAVIPSVLSGKITSSVLNTGREFINHAFSKKDDDSEKGKLVAAIKQVGIFTALRLAYKAFFRRK